MLDMVIRNGQVVTPDGVRQADVAIEGEQIVAVDAPDTLSTDVGRAIDAAGKLVIPGGIDPHMHLHSIVPRRDGSVDTSAPASHVSQAALFGGTTTLVDFAVVRPDGKSIPEAIERQEEVCRAGYCDYAFHIHLQGEVPFEVIEQIPEAIQSGFCSFKAFTTDVKPSRRGRMVPTGYIMGILEQTARHGGILAVHAEDDDIVRYMYAKLAREGRDHYVNMPLVHSAISEEVAFRRVINLVKHIAGAAVYFVHVSAKTGVEAVAEARAAGLPVYGETLHNYMSFTSDAYHRPDGVIYHTYPSLKSEEDRLRLWSGIIGGDLSTVATDEVNTTLAVKKEMLEASSATGGHVGVETRLGIIYTEGVSRQGMSLERFVEVTSTNASKILGMYPRKGVIAVGSDADIVVFDPTVRRTLRAEELHDSDYSIWEGWEVHGWPEITILRGKVAMESGELKVPAGYAKRPFTKLMPEIQAGPAV